MTPLRSGSPLRRVTAARWIGRPLRVECHPGFVLIWPEGRRRSECYMVDWVSVFQLGGRIRNRENLVKHAARLRRERGE